MGQHYLLDSQYTSQPIEVEGRAHWAVKTLAETDERVSVLVAFWSATAELGKQTVHATRSIVERAGGTVADWEILCAAACDSSDTDDVVEILADNAWGQRILWVAWHLFAGYSI